jgi:putative ABC transport system permease protein
VARFYDRLIGRLAAAPGVRQIGVTSIAPLSGLLATVPFAIEGRQAPERDRTSANLRAISPGYLSSVGTRLVQGRPFAESDRADTPHVALVSAALADRLLSGNGVGQRLLVDDNNKGPRRVEIVGVVENVWQTALDLPPAFDIYIPLRQIHRDGVGFVRNNQFWMVKTDSDAAAFGTTFITHLRAIDPDAAVSGIGSMRQFIDGWLGPRRFNVALFAAFAFTAILLAVSGLYGLVAYAVSQRASEIGLRMAIGATHGEVHRMILGQAATLGISGSVIGLLLGIAGRPLMRGLVQDASIDPVIVAATAALLIAVVLMAAWLPARRAARIDPSLALKTN